MMNYQRSAERVATSLLGTMELGDALSTCLVTDVSSRGARLRVSGSKPLPRTFRLLISRLDLSRQAAVRWRAGEEVGIEFQPGEVLRFRQVR